MEPVKEDRCRVCGGELRFVYRPALSLQENVVATYPMKVDNEPRRLMCCEECGLLYAKKEETI